MKKLLIVLVSLILCSFGLAYGQNISLDHVEGLVDGETDVIEMDQLITFHIRMTAGEENYGGITNGFSISSVDAEWITTTADTTGTIGKAEFDLVWSINTFGITGSGADTVGFGGAYMYGTGMLAGFDDITYTITIGPIDASYEGKQVCLDSCFYPSSGTWMWTTPEAITVFPEWDGPHCYWIGTTGSDVKNIPGDGRPTSFALSQNYPNPFNPRTEIRFDLPKRSHVSLSIYNVLGQEVTTLIDEMLPCDHYVVDWDGTGSNGAPVASGVYFYRIEADNFIETKKMVLLK